MKTACLLLFLSLPLCARAQSGASSEVEPIFPAVRDLYADLHQTPELSSHETATAAKLAARLRSLGYEVTEGIGGTGVVALLKNGPGPVIMLRTELDALPVEEKTGLAYASKVRVKDESGSEVSVMHACGHDIHMASLIGTADIMAHTRSTWHGTLMLILQPAEEAIGGAARMIADGVFTRFPKPSLGIALHVGNELPATQIGITPGIYSTNSDAIHVTIYGKGGHGSAPHTTIDPIVIAARTVLALENINARELKPGEFGVVTVGFFRAGTRPNIIPDKAEFGLTVRTYKDEVRKQILAAIPRIVKAEALAGGATKEPTIEQEAATGAVYNDPALAQRLRGPLEAALGKENVVTEPPNTASEDYSYFIKAGVPSLYMTLGGANPQKFAEAKASGTMLPSNHSPFFAPDADLALRTGIKAEVAALRNLLDGK